MYYPYFRGKQFELITIRETAPLLAKAGFTPIIEPVKETLKGLERALNQICDAGGNAIVVTNPDYGDHSENNKLITDFLKKGFLENTKISAGILLKEGMSIEDVKELLNQHKAHNPIFIHSGFDSPKDVAELLDKNLDQSHHIFFEKFCGKLYRKHFKGATRVLLRDGFKKRRNADHPEVEEFSDLHVTYPEEDMDGFGDFLIVGDDYSEGGGPAYAVAIHLTFIDKKRDDVMYIYHFVSITKDTPTDPAGKFGQALDKLINKLNSNDSGLLETDAIKEFRVLHEHGHFPGLGYVKKLSMKHHLETLANYFS